MNPRSIKVEADGDTWKKKIKPKIRLMGRWLEQMGFPPGRRVEVSLIEPGVLQIKLKPEACAQISGPLGFHEGIGNIGTPTLHSFEHCVARIQHLENERRKAFSKAWREHCKREIAEWEAYIAEHYPNLRRPK